MPPQTLPARLSTPIHLLPSQTLKILNPHGTQVVDLFAIAPLPSSTPSSTPTPRAFLHFNYLSMPHTRSSLGKISLLPGDSLRDNTRAPLLTLTEDTSGGVHDTLFAACDRFRYRQLGVEGWHASCAENLAWALGRAASAARQAETATAPEDTGTEDFARLTPGMEAALAAAATATQEWTPDPLNLFMNVPVQALSAGKGGELRLEAATCPKGGYVVLRAEQECVVVLSACPMDLNAIYVAFHEVEWEVLDAAS